MLNIDQILEANGNLFRTDFGAYAFTWRLLSLKEYKVFDSLRASGALHPMQLYSEVFDRCYIGDSSFISGGSPAGLTISIGQLIMWVSGDAANTTLVEDINAARESYLSLSVEEHMRRIIMIAVPSYTFEDVESWTRPELYHKFARAEAILVNRGGYEPMDLSKITSGAEAASNAKKGIDVEAMQRDNRDMAQAMGDRAHPLDQHPAELEKKRKIASAMQRRRQR